MTAKLTDREPTQEMIDAAVMLFGLANVVWRDGWRAMWDAAPAAREWSDAEVEQIRKRVIAAQVDVTGGGNQRSIIFQIALIRAGLAAAAPAKEPQHPPQDAPAKEPKP